jgi:3-oxoacyl-[acyl-carrier protein] reductase
MGEFTSPFDLDGRTAVISGGAKGIGRQAAIIFARAGANVVVADIDQAGLDETASLVREHGTEVSTVGADVSVKAEVDGVAEHALATFGRLDVWANVAGVLAYAPIVDTTEADLDRVIGVNLKGVYWGSAAAARSMTAAGSGSIINIASAGGEVPAAGISVYALTKAAVMMLTRTLAVEVGPSGVRANSVAPGFVETPMTAVHFTNDDGSIDESRRHDILQARATQSPLAITGTTEDIGYAMLYLASDASKFMTGQVMRPNGGVYMG